MKHELNSRMRTGGAFGATMYHEYYIFIFSSQVLQLQVHCNMHERSQDRVRSVRSVEDNLIQTQTGNLESYIFKIVNSRPVSTSSSCTILS